MHKFERMNAYEWQLQLLCRVDVLHHQLAERLPDTVATAFFGHLVEMIIGYVEFVLGLRVCAHTLPGADDLLYCTCR